ncbi:hypothetical protein, partial [Telluria aromaticivorans]|uniref:hypothetical protein n=1 Tax=Telluria aromaticivorans TaxID=2725995 RepID=UPI001BB24603
QRRKHPLKSECDFWKTDILTLLKADISTLLLQGGQILPTRSDHSAAARAAIHIATITAWAGNLPTLRAGSGFR